MFTAWDFHRDGSYPADLFRSAADFAGEVLDQCRLKNPGNSPDLGRAREFLTEVRRRVGSWLPSDAPTPRLKTALVPVTPRSPSAFSKMRDLWPGSTPPNILYVLSPFFDQGTVNGPAKAAWELMRQRGGAQMNFCVVAEPMRNSERLMVHAPEALRSALPEDGRDASIHFDRIKMPQGRALHAKSLWLANDDHLLRCVGSSNFTTPGLGLGPHRHWELNVAAWTRLDNREETKAHEDSWPDLEDDELDPDAVAWQPLPPAEDEADPLAPVIPDWCGSAVFSIQNGGQAVLELSFTGQPSGEWSVWNETGTVVLLTSEAWRVNGEATTVQLNWSETRPPSGLVVRSQGVTGDAHWPVEVRSFNDLPPPQELRDLSLEQLLAILTSSLPLHRCLQKMLRQETDEPAPSEISMMLDPLRRFAQDKEKHLLERTRRFSLAMAGMRQRLEAPIPSEEYLQWRLFGPIGITKLAAAILNEAASDGERIFLLGELALELSQVRPCAEPGYLNRARVRDALSEVVAGFEKQVESLLPSADPNLCAYVRSALKKARP